MRSSVKQVLSMVRLLAPLRTVRNWFVKAPQTISPMEHLKQYAAKLGIKVIPSREVIDVCRGKDTIRISTSHEIYTHDMVKYFDYYFRAVSPDLKSDQRIVDYSYPRLHCLQPSGVELEFPSLPESDETTEVYLKALDLQPGDCMLDLGAYAGASAYFFSKAVGPDGLVIAFEPDQKTFPYLLGNIKRHQLINVNPVAKGVWKETTTLRFSSEGNLSLIHI